MSRLLFNGILLLIFIIMTKRFVLFLFSMIALVAGAQNVAVNISVPDTSHVDGLKLYIHNIVDTKSNPTEMVLDGNTFSADVERTVYGIYQIAMTNGDRQMMLCVYIPTDADSARFVLGFKDDMPFVNADAENALLSKVFKMNAVKGRIAFNGEFAGDDERLAFLKSYATAADSLLAASECKNATVRDFSVMWACMSAYMSYCSFDWFAKREHKTLSFSVQDALGSDLNERIDSEIAALFGRTVNELVLRSIPKGESLSADLAFLSTKYKTPAIRVNAGEALVAKFLSDYDYSADFEGGLSQIKEAVEKYGIDERFLKEYESRRAMIKGTPFPADVVLHDAAGNVVDFSSFKGKYVYVDMWASWCGPCCREVPHLQKLESELQNKDVVFVSISVDRDERAWKNKMEALSMHGNQLIDRENRLPSVLGARGIPFFVIYDKEGRLYMYGAPRPSDAATKNLLEGLK